MYFEDENCQLGFNNLNVNRRDPLLDGPASTAQFPSSQPAGVRYMSQDYLNTTGGGVLDGADYPSR